MEEVQEQAVASERLSAVPSESALEPVARAEAARAAAARAVAARAAAARRPAAHRRTGGLVLMVAGRRAPSFQTERMGSGTSCTDRGCFIF